MREASSFSVDRDLSIATGGREDERQSMVLDGVKRMVVMETRSWKGYDNILKLRVTSEVGVGNQGNTIPWIKKNVIRKSE